MTTQPKSPVNAALELNILGAQLQMQGKLSDAGKAYREAIKLQPDNAEIHNSLGLVLKKQERLKEAESSYRKAIELNPDYVDAWSNLGGLCLDQYRTEEAREIYDKVRQLEPDFAEAIRHNVMLRQEKYDDPNHPDVKHIETLLCKSNMPDNDAMQLYFALAKIYDDCGSYDEAFSCYKKGNQCKSKLMPFAIDEAQTYFTKLIDTFNQTLLANHSNNLSTLPVFIVGMPRSGKTLLEKILSQHPDISPAGESKIIQQVASTIPNYPEGIMEIDHEILNRLASKCDAHLRQYTTNNEQRITLTFPFNFEHLGLIYQLFPHAHIVHCTRNPMDTCLFNYFKYFAKVGSFTSDLHNIVLYHQTYKKLMAHWQKTLPNNILQVKYEELVDNTEETLQEVIAFLGLKWDESYMPNFPIHCDEIDHWKHYEKHLTALTEVLDE